MSRVMLSLRSMLREVATDVGRDCATARKILHGRRPFQDDTRFLPHRDIKSIVPQTQILAVRERKPNSEDAHLSLRPQVPEPFLRAQPRRGVGNFAGIEKRPELYRKDSGPINVLVCLPVRQKIILPQGSAALPTVP